MSTQTRERLDGRLLPQRLLLPLLLLLSRDLQSACRDLQLLCHDLQFDGQHAAPLQPVLPSFEGFAAPRIVATRRKPLRTTRAKATAEDPLLAAYLRRLAARGASTTGVAAYRYQLHWMARWAGSERGQAMTLRDLFADEELLGPALVADEDASGRQLSRWSLAQRRSAARSFASLMAPELMAATGCDPHEVLDGALRDRAIRVGAGFRLTGGAPRKRGGQAPTKDQLEAILSAARQAPGYEGARDFAFLLILSETGARVNALRMLDGADCFEMPNGRIRMFLHEKGKAEPREVELNREAASSLHRYFHRFNGEAASRGWNERLSLGEAGAVWRSGAKARWSYSSVITRLRAHCASAKVTPIAPHALRRAFATEAASMLPRHVVALAGGWQGLERLDDHYIQPRRQVIFSKLSNACQNAGNGGVGEHDAVPTAAAVHAAELAT